MKKQKSIGRQRLAKLATFLYRVPRDRFNMNRWKAREYGTLSLNPIECNTQGCAIGWATILFAEDGFCLSTNDGYGSIPVPNWNGCRNWKAIEKFLDLSYEDAFVLFASNDETRHLGPRQVAVRIRKFLKTGRT